MFKFRITKKQTKISAIFQTRKTKQRFVSIFDFFAFADATIEESVDDR